MSVLETQKIHIVSLQEHKEKILELLQHIEVIDIQAMDRAPASAGEELGRLDYDLAEIRSAVVFLEKLSRKKKGLVESFAPQKELVSLDELERVCRGFDCKALLEQVEAIETRLANLDNLTTELRNDIKLLSPWRKLPLPLDQLNNTKHTAVLTGQVKTRHLPDLDRALAIVTNAFQVDIVRRERDISHILIVCLLRDLEAVRKSLGSTSFEPLCLPEVELTPAEEIARLETLLAENEAEKKEQLDEAVQLAGNLSRLKYMHDMVLDTRVDWEVKQRLADTRYTFIIEGWIRSRDLKKLQADLKQLTPETEIYRIEAAKDEKHPVVLENPRIFSPFELITQMYGTPKYEEFDPSVPLSFFFALFFGICLGDLGYGLALTLVSLYFLKRYRLPLGGIKLFRLLILGGLTSMVVGLLTGSYFGAGPAAIPEFLSPVKHCLLSIQIIDPIRDPLVMLIFTLALGVVQILFGFVMQLTLHVRRGEYVAAALDDGLWLFFLSSLVFLMVTGAASSSLSGLASKLSLSGAAALVLTQGRHKKTLIEKFLSGLLSLYKVSGYMGDTLSYSRLLALGMSSAIIGSVINILAGMVKGVPLLGIVLMIALLIFGHIFNLIISTMSAFVHSTRLQMVEFFSKFYEGGGREFKPYKRQAEYTLIK
ncbi:MAG: V-type ATP synthase subunit I [Candidatus Saganbacteria bacterium]|nr:V-type ATP synthase subunit I [Candidatus Saganbacteria bacterium]